MISVIVSTGQPPEWDTHQQHVAAHIGAEFEYIRIDNRGAAMSLSAAYNKGVERAQGDILVFVHDDVFFLTMNWGRVLEEKFAADTSIGLVGVAGTQYIGQDNPRWFAMGWPFIKGVIIHQGREINSEPNVTYYSDDRKDADVVVADGLCLAIRREVFSSVRFDEENFDAFHFYDLDICMQIRRTHRLIVTRDILVKHLSRGDFTGSWDTYRKRFLQKYSSSLPASSTTKPFNPLLCRGGEGLIFRHVFSPKTYQYIQRNHQMESEGGSARSSPPKALELELFHLHSDCLKVSPALLKRIPGHARTLVNIGCLAGISMKLYKKGNPRCRCLGIESDPTTAKLAKKLNNLDRVIVGDPGTIELHQFGLEHGQVDVIVYDDILGKIMDPWAMLRAHAPYLKRGGKVVARIQNISHWITLYYLMQGEWPYADSGIYDLRNIRHFGPLTFVDLFRQASMKVVDIDRIPATDTGCSKFITAFSPAVKAIGLNTDLFAAHVETAEYVVVAHPE